MPPVRYKKITKLIELIEKKLNKDEIKEFKRMFIGEKAKD